MQLQIGNYFFPTNAVECQTDSRTIFSSTGRPIRYVLGFTGRATIYGTSQRDISDREEQMRAALITPYKDLILRCDDGTASSVKLLNNTSITGVRLTKGPDFSEVQGGEFVNRRTATFSMEAEYVIRGAEDAVISWTESVTIQGNGGPDRFWRFPINPGVAPIRQVKTPYSLVVATQSGAAVGHTRRPFRPLPIWPGYLVNTGDTTAIETPEPKGKAYLNWPIKWSYTFHRGDGPLIGFPSLPPMP